MAKVQQKFQFPKTYRIKIRFHDMIRTFSPTLSQITHPVATTETRTWQISWNRLFFIIPLQCRKETTTTETRKENKYNN